MTYTAMIDDVAMHIRFPQTQHKQVLYSGKVDDNLYMVAYNLASDDEAREVSDILGYPLKNVSIPKPKED